MPKLKNLPKHKQPREKLIEKGTVLSVSIRDMKRFIIGGACELELDTQGRFVLPLNLKNYAQINNEIRFIGIKDWVEIWAFDNWQKKLEELTKNASDIAEKIFNRE
jgi:MraZ protein